MKTYTTVLVLSLGLVGCFDKETKPLKPSTPKGVIVIDTTPDKKEEPKKVQTPEPKRTSRFNTKWDSDFKKWTKVYLPLYDYTLLKAQCYQESLLDPKAVSHVGAKGLCQFMDYTWDDVRKPLKFSAEANAFNPSLSIQAAAFYDARLRSSWKSKRPDYDRMNLTLASYNAGMGNIIKAQKACGNKSLYNEIIACLPDITGRHAKETKTYVRRIRRWESEMQLEM